MIPTIGFLEINKVIIPHVNINMGNTLLFTAIKLTKKNVDPR